MQSYFIFRQHAIKPAPMRVFLVNPETPLLLWEGPNDIAEVHDIHVRDNEAILNCGFDGIRIYDFTNPSNPIFTQSIEFYNDQGYNHQGFLFLIKKHMYLPMKILECE